MRYAVIDSETNIVLNVVMLDNAEQWAVHGPSSYVVLSDSANIGDTYTNGEFIAPAPTE